MRGKPALGNASLEAGTWGGRAAYPESTQ